LYRLSFLERTDDLLFSANLLPLRLVCLSVRPGLIEYLLFERGTDTRRGVELRRADALFDCSTNICSFSSGNFAQ
jgi:hypothetical protein